MTGARAATKPFRGNHGFYFFSYACSVCIADIFEERSLVACVVVVKADLRTVVGMQVPHGLCLLWLDAMFIVEYITG